MESEFLTREEHLRLECLKIAGGKIDLCEQLLCYVRDGIVKGAAETAINLNEAPYNIPIQELYPSMRVFNALFGEGIYTLGDLCGFPKRYIQRIRNIGRDSLHEIDNLLEKNGLTYAMWESPKYIEKCKRYGRR